ncbi:MAG TPA: tRNA (adenosine(37)-N6)-threonylcarbamoyltransferase complex dimerization subunit type 1 TsaB [Hymenobacter sp.]
MLAWTAHRQLAETLHRQIDDILAGQGMSLQDVQGIVIYEGPGSFTGLRIGMSVANALGYSYGIPVGGFGGSQWRQDGLRALSSGDSPKIALPEYGSAVFVTAPRK